MSTMHSKENVFGKPILDLTDVEFKAHIDEQGGKDGWAPAAMKIRSSQLLPMIEKFQTLYKGKNPNKKIFFWNREIKFTESAILQILLIKAVAALKHSVIIKDP